MFTANDSEFNLNVLRKSSKWSSLWFEDCPLPDWETELLKIESEKLESIDLENCEITNMKNLALFVKRQKPRFLLTFWSKIKMNRNQFYRYFTPGKLEDNREKPMITLLHRKTRAELYYSVRI